MDAPKQLYGNPKPRSHKFSPRPVVIFLVVIFGAAAVILFLRPKPFDRAAMLRSTAEQCIVPGVVELSRDTQDLFLAGQTLLQDPNPKTDGDARHAWTQLHQAEERNQVHFGGVMMDSAFWGTIFYHPISPEKLEETIRGNLNINQDLIELAGARSKGSYAMEYLLFGSVADSNTNSNSASSDKMLERGTGGERRRLLFRELARNMESHLQEATNESAGFSTRFAEGKNESINLLMENIVSCVETKVVMPLADSLSANEKGGLPGGTSLEALKATLEGVHFLYTGGNGPGLDDQVKRINLDLAKRLEIQFSAAKTALDLIDIPLDQAVVSRRAGVEKAVAECKNLEHLFKVDLTSALGVSVTFNSIDND
jgi:hypothetical protein